MLIMTILEKLVFNYIFLLVFLQIKLKLNL